MEFRQCLDKIAYSENYSIVDTVKGDLNKDGIDELVIAYNTQKEKEDAFESVPRELIIYKKESNNWIVWKNLSLLSMVVEMAE